MSKRFKKVYIEISNVCNLQCQFCPEVIREKHFMDIPLFQKVIDEVAPLTDEVCFHVMGEPLVHPNFEKYIEICQRQDVRVNITSNGMLLNEARTRALLNPTVSQVNFSLHSFESNYPDKDIGSYLEKILSFTKNALVQRPDLYINYRLWNLGQSSADQSKNGDIFDRIKKEFNVDFDQNVDVKWKKGVNVKGRIYIHIDTRFQWPHPQNPIRSEAGFCHGLSSHIGILADGRVVPCCLDKEGVIELGSCRGSQSIYDIVNGDRARNISQGFKAGILVEDLCRRCTFISRFDGKAQKLRNSRMNPTNIVVAAQST